ncbi:MAG: IS200/IS605 family transposase [Anaerolineales bacterium]|nr:IS200/IS605 family transposase [Anaerolineales bacterium]
MSFWRTYYHVVWATKNREPFITPELEPYLYDYLLGKSHELEVIVYAIGNWTDHIHLLVSIPPKLAVASVVKRLKGASSHYIETLGLFEHQFEWQRGYGVFTLGETQRGRAEAYVRNQKVHHQNQTTNAWLEKTDEFDDGPPDKGLTVREPRAIYDIGDDFPF